MEVAGAGVCTHLLWGPAAGICVMAGTIFRHTCSGGGQCMQHELRPTTGSLAAVGNLVVDMLSYGCTVSPWACALWWRTLIDINQVVCKLTAVGTSLVCMLNIGG